MIKSIISWLLHHANRQGPDQYFYKVKHKILNSGGARHLGYDLQFIGGKKCYSCGGSGKFFKWDHYESCWNCHDGWYKRPRWNYLEKVEYGRYIFHQPFKSVHVIEKSNGTSTTFGFGARARCLQSFLNGHDPHCFIEGLASKPTFMSEMMSLRIIRACCLYRSSA